MSCLMVFSQCLVLDIFYLNTFVVESSFIDSAFSYCVRASFQFFIKLSTASVPAFYDWCFDWTQDFAQNFVFFLSIISIFTRFQREDTFRRVKTSKFDGCDAVSYSVWRSIILLVNIIRSAVNYFRFSQSGSASLFV